MRAIAANLACAPSTVSRELRRHRDPQSRYRPHTAHQAAAVARARSRGRRLSPAKPRRAAARGRTPTDQARDPVEPGADRRALAHGLPGPPPPTAMRGEPVPSHLRPRRGPDPPSEEMPSSPPSPTFPSRGGSLTWDQGKEMALHAHTAAATGMSVYFCQARSPWQRGSNENVNGLLRQYFHKATDPSVHTADDMRRVTDELNARPARRCSGPPRPASWKPYAQPLNRRSVASPPRPARRTVGPENLTKPRHRDRDRIVTASVVFRDSRWCPP